MPEAVEAVVERFELPAEAPQPVEVAEPEVAAVEPEVLKEEPKDVPKEEPTDQELEKRRQSRRDERKIGNAYRKAAEAEARANLLEQQLNELRKPPVVEGAPKAEDFADVEEYAKAREEFGKKQAVKEYQDGQRKEAQKTTQLKLTEAWNEKVSKAKYDDFDEIVGDLKPTTPWAMAIMQSDNGDEVAYYLGKNLKEAERITSLDPISQVREIGRLQAKLELQPPQVKQPSKAPAPIKPISGTSLAETGPNEEQDMGDWIRSRNKQLRGR